MVLAAAGLLAVLRSDHHRAKASPGGLHPSELTIHVKAQAARGREPGYLCSLHLQEEIIPSPL